MKKYIRWLSALLLAALVCPVALADEVEDAAPSAQQPVITVQPSGISMEVSTASFYLQVSAEVTDGGELSCQWLETDATGGSETPLDGETGFEFSPTQSIGTRYYRVRVTNTLGESKSSTLSSIAVVTFSGRQLWYADVRGIDAPVAGAKPDTTAERYTEDAINEFFGYKITTVQWSPADAVFKHDIAYTVMVTIEFENDVSVMSSFFGRINGREALNSTYEGGPSYTFSYTFDKTAPAPQPVIKAQPQSVTVAVGERAEFSVTAESAGGGALHYIWYTGDKEDGEYLAYKDSDAPSFGVDAVEAGTRYFKVEVYEEGAADSSVTSSPASMTVTSDAPVSSEPVVSEPPSEPTGEPASEPASEPAGEPASEPTSSEPDPVEPPVISEPDDSRPGALSTGKIVLIVVSSLLVIGGAAFGIWFIWRKR